MATFFRRLARVATPFTTTKAINAFKDQSKSKSQIPLGAIAAVSGGISYFFYFSSPTMVHLDRDSEEVDPKVALNPDKWIEFELTEKARVSHNTQLFRFSFDPTAKLGLDIASCLLTRAPQGENAEGKTKYVIRPYTPISDSDAKGYFDLLIKVYPEGKMSQHLASLKPGDVIEVKGPIEKLRYSPNMKKHIGMIAGGTGITPMLQIIEAILKNSDDNTKVSLIYGNVSPDDILLKEKLDILSASHPNLKIFYTVDEPSKNWRGGAGGTGITPMLQIIEAILKNSDDNTKVSLIYGNVSPDDILLKEKLDILSASHPNLKIFYTVDEPSKNWRGGAGYISKDMIVKGLPSPSEDTLILVCGPPGLMNHISGNKGKDWSQGELTGLLKEVGYTEDMVYKF
ncbi:Nadh-cytochrome b5 reductase-like protein [Thalictrum thalictroides]|uniref:cytochrome-b5 reductase n=2 Tax=Thalictrum thalictroides TaxID=46969 RepID=A0A7J6X3F4_THATH|nr:Nadh-cytochrome b5 reductase-like protein [Thalictrum thalictroides]